MGGGGVCTLIKTADKTNMKTITLRHGQTTIVDDDDYEELNQFKWGTTHNGYAYRRKVINGVSRRILMHRVVNQTPDGLSTDHINRDKLDNRKSNLRSATNSLNMLNRGLTSNNRTGLKRLYFMKTIKLWRVQIRRRNSKLVDVILYQKYSKSLDKAIDYLLAAEKIHLDPEFWQTRPEKVNDAPSQCCLDLVF